MLSSNNIMKFLLALLVSLTIAACGEDDCSDEGGEEAGEMAGEMAADDMAEDDACESAAGEAAAGTMAGETAGDTAGDTAGETAGDTAGDTAGETPVVTYNYVVVQDKSEYVNGVGTPGVDICEIDLECDTGDSELEVSIGAVEADLGKSGACESAADNGDDGCVCVGQAVTEDNLCGTTDRNNEDRVIDGDRSCAGDDYVSTGIEGWIAVEVENLSACESLDVTVFERGGGEEEAYVVGLCADLDNITFSDIMMGDSCLFLGEATIAEDPSKSASSRDFSK